MKTSRALERLDDRRREAERRLDDVREALRREVGWRPEKPWIVPLVGFACGLALAVGVRLKRRSS